MLQIHALKEDPLDCLANSDVLPLEAAWIDLLRPTDEEVALIERTFKVEIPSRQKLFEIEPSSRLYADDGSLYMTANAVCRADCDEPLSHPVAFILNERVLITVRHDEPRSFALFAANVSQHPHKAHTAPEALLGLLDTIVDRGSDLLEHVGNDVDTIMKEVFGIGATRTTKLDHDYPALMSRIGHAQDLVSKARDSLDSFIRMIGFLGVQNEGNPIRETRHLQAVATLIEDAKSMTDRANFLNAQISFTMDAVMGLVSIQQNQIGIDQNRIANEQNQIMKVLAVASVLFMAPTFLAGLWGMNFKSMPELELPYGYPMALCAMTASVLLGIFFFWRRGWFK
jgi:magnesium transporter